MNLSSLDPGSVLGAIAIIVASTILYVQNRNQIKKTEKVSTKASEVHDTLLANNGGSSIKDQLDRIEHKTDNLDSRVTVIDQRLYRYRTDFEQRIAQEGTLRDEVVKRIDHLEVQFKPSEGELHE